MLQRTSGYCSHKDSRIAHSRISHTSRISRSRSCTARFTSIQPSSLDQSHRANDIDPSTSPQKLLPVTESQTLATLSIKVAAADSASVADADVTGALGVLLRAVVKFFWRFLAACLEIFFLDSMEVILKALS